MEESNLLKSVFIPFGELVARNMADELEVKNGLLQPKEVYIKQKTQDVVSAIEQEILTRDANLNKAAVLLREHLSSLSILQKEKIEKEMIEAEKKVVDLLSKKQEVSKEDTFQSLLGFSNETLIWIYSVGYQSFQEKKGDDAFVIFQMLTTLNPLVADYWIAQGLTQKMLEKDIEALHSFSMASVMKPNNPIPRFHSVDLYLRLGQLDNAKLEFGALEKIMEIGNYSDLRSFVDVLRNKIQFAKTG